MIPRSAITHWNKQVPWEDIANVEQDLIITRALTDIFSDDFLDTGNNLRDIHIGSVYKYGILSEDFAERSYKGRPQPRFLTTVRDACLRGMTAEEAPLDESCGLISGEFLFAYPPGVPLLIPGEMITDETIKFAKNAGSDLYMNGRRSFDGKIKVLP